MALPVSNSYEGGTDAATITTGNSGGTSGTAFNTVGIAATHALTYTSTPGLAGARAANLVPGGTSGQTYCMWTTTALGSFGPTFFVRFYCMYPAVPNGSVNNRILEVDGAGAQRMALAHMGSAASGKFTWANAANTLGTNSTSVMQPNVVYRFEVKVVLSTTVGQITTRFFLGHDTVPQETLDSGASLNLGATTADQAVLGLISSGTATTYVASVVLDEFAVSSTDWIGPATYPHPMGKSDIGQAVRARA